MHNNRFPQKNPRKKADSEGGCIFENFTPKQGNSLKILAAGTRNHGVSFPPLPVNELKKLYVYDPATSSETDNKAYQMYTTAKQILSEGQFNLRKWRTNSKILLKRINEAENLPFDDTARQ